MKCRGENWQGQVSWTHLYCLVGCLNMTGHKLFWVLHACVLYFCNCTCSVQLSMFHMERHSRNTIIIIIITIILFKCERNLHCKQSGLGMSGVLSSDPFSLLQPQGHGVRIAQSVVCWAHCLVWCRVAGWNLLWASGRGDFFPLELTWTPFPLNSFGWEYKPMSSLCTHAFHCTDTKEPDVHVLDGWMPATKKTHPACTIQEDRIWLPVWLDKKAQSHMENSHQ